MDIVRSIVMAFCMFSSIPMPKVKADEHSSRFMMAAFPLVGVVCGAVCIAWWAFCIWAHIGVFLHAAGLVLIPLIIAGGIHLDGFADVVDAISSWGTPERRREILKDSHIGAFAAMGICVYLLLSFALCTELVQTASLYTAFLLGLTFVLSRVLSGLTGMLFPKSSTEGCLLMRRQPQVPKRSSPLWCCLPLRCLRQWHCSTGKPVLPVQLLLLWRWRCCGELL